MKNNKKWINLLLALVMAVTAIGAFAQPALGEGQQGEENQILFTGNEATIQGTGAQHDGRVTTINQGGTYRLAGSYNGQIVIDAIDKGKVTLVLNGLTLSSPDGPALWEKQSGGLEIVLTENTQNTFSDGYKYTIDEQDKLNGALHVKNSLTITGQGSLSLTGNYENGMTVKDDLVIEAGTLTITSNEKGIKAKNMYLNGGTVTINSKDDAMNAGGSITILDGNYTLTCGDDGIHADEDLLVQGGNITINTQNEGMEAARITFAGGSTAIYALDDGINADGGDDAAVYKENGKKDGEAVQENVYVSIEGGEIYISTGEGDGLDSNGNVMMSGGTLTIEGMEGEREAAIDYNGTFELTGGRVIALGGAQMGQAPTSENQSVLVLYQMGQKEIPFTLQSALGEEILTFTPQKNYQMVVLTHENLTEGETYTLLIGEEAFTFENITKGVNQLGQGGGKKDPEGRGGMAFDGSQPSKGGKPLQRQRPDWISEETPLESPEGFELPEGMGRSEGMAPPINEKNTVNP